MTDFFANSAFLGLGVWAIFSGRENFQSGVEIACAAVGLILLHKIEGHLYNQTVLMVADEGDEVEYQEHPDFPLDLD